jgi:hypothetical protein
VKIGADEELWAELVNKHGTQRITTGSHIWRMMGYSSTIRSAKSSR